MRDFTPYQILRGHTGGILDVAFPAGGRELFTVAERGPFGDVAPLPNPLDAARLGNPFGVFVPFLGIDGWCIGNNDGTHPHTAARPSWDPTWEVKRWDVDSGLSVRTVLGRSAKLTCAAFSPAADRVAVGAVDETVQVWDTRTGRQMLSVRVSDPPLGLAYGPGGAFVVVLVKQRQVSGVVILDVASGRQRQLVRPEEYIAELALSPDGHSLARGVPYLPGQLQVWSVDTGKKRWSQPKPAWGLAFSADNRFLAGVTRTGTTVVWDAATGDKQFELVDSQPRDTQSLAFSADGERLATADRQGSVVVWDLRTRQEVYSFKSGQKATDRVAFRADKAALVAWNTRDVAPPIGEVLVLSATTVPSRTYLEGALPDNFMPGLARPTARFTPDGRRVAVAAPRNEILLFDAASGERLRAFTGHTLMITALAFSDNGRRLVSAGVAVPDDDAAAGLGRADGQQFVSVGASPVQAAAKALPSEVMVWDTDTGKQLAHLANVADGRRPLQVALSPDGTSVAVRNDQGKLLAWSIETKQPVPVVGDPFAGHERQNRTADGRRVGEWGKYYVERTPDARDAERMARPDPAWHAAKARAAEADKRWFAAGFHLSRLLLESPGDMTLLCRRARAYTAQQRWQRARADCDQAIRLHPKPAEALLTRAMLEYQMWDSIDHCLRDADPWLALGLLEFAQDHLRQAHADLARAAAAAPNDAGVIGWQAFLHFVDRQDDKAAALERLMYDRMRLYPAAGICASADKAPVWQWLDEALAQRLACERPAVALRRLLGAVRMIRGRPGDAWPGYGEAVRSAPRDLLACKGYACSLWESQSDLGHKACDRVLQLDPQAWDFWYLRGAFCEGRSQQCLPEAIQAYTRALELRRNFAPALRSRGAVYAHMGQWDKAIVDLARAAELTGPADPTVWDWLALAQLGRGDTAAYRKTCARMLTLFGRPAPAIWAGGVFAAGPLNPWGGPLALHAAEQAASLSPDFVAVSAGRCTTRPDTLADWQPLLALTAKSYGDVRGAVLCRAGRFDEALELLEPQFTWQYGIGPDERLLTLYRALAEHGRGHRDRAVSLLKEVTREPPSDLVHDWTVRVQIEQLRRELEAALR